MNKRIGVLALLGALLTSGVVWARWGDEPAAPASDVSAAAFRHQCCQPVSWRAMLMQP